MAVRESRLNTGFALLCHYKFIIVIINYNLSSILNVHVCRLLVSIFQFSNISIILILFVIDISLTFILVCLSIFIIFIVFDKRDYNSLNYCMAALNITKFPFYFKYLFCWCCCCCCSYHCWFLCDWLKYNMTTFIYIAMSSCQCHIGNNIRRYSVNINFGRHKHTYKASQASKHILI